MKREHWKSRLGFIWAAVGSAVGLGSIWRFPYVVGENGGATFVIFYLICLLLVGLPVLVSEILIGRKAQLSPGGAFRLIGKNRGWGWMGKITIATGFLVSAFYCVIAGWTLGYLIEAVLGNLTHLNTSEKALLHFETLSSSPLFSIGCQAGFILLSAFVLYTGVRKGIEAGNKVMMPLLILVLIVLIVKGLTMTGAGKGIEFLFYPDWSKITPTAIIMALGQAFFALSLGQGTMVTYGSYASKSENLPLTCFPIALFGTFISIMAGIAIFTIVFAVGMPPTSGDSLMFQTLPIVFSEIPGGYFLAILFFVLLLLAAVTSQISAMEPLISYLIDQKKMSRHKAVMFTAIGVFIVGVPSALSFGILKGWTIFGQTFFGAMVYLCVNILIPLGGLAAVILVGWRWGIKKAIPHLKQGADGLFDRYPFLEGYFRWGIKYIAPCIVLLIILDLVGIF